MAGTHRETFEFKPQLSANLGRQLLLVTVIIVFFTVAIFILFPGTLTILKRSIHSQKFWLSFAHDPRMYVGPIVFVGAIVWMYLCNKYERLLMGPDGIRYVSPFGGKWSIFKSLKPDWSLAWSEVGSVVIQSRHTGISQYEYSLVVAPDGVAKRLSYPLRWRRVPFAPGSEAPRGRRNPDAMREAIRQSPLVLALKYFGVKIEERRGPLQRHGMGYDISKNRGLMVAVGLLVVCGGYLFYYLAMPHYMYLQTPPIWPFILTAGIGFAAGVWLGKTAPATERYVMSVLLAGAVAAAAYPGLLQINALTEPAGNDVYRYTQIGIGHFEPPDSTLPAAVLTGHRDYWAHFKNGSVHAFRIVRGQLNFYQLDLGRLIAEERAWWQARRAARH